MSSFQGRRPHRSIPVETDERMPSAGADLFQLEQCCGHEEVLSGPGDRGAESDQRDGCSVGQNRPLYSPYQHQRSSVCPASPVPHMVPPAAANAPHPADVWCHDIQQQQVFERDFMGDPRKDSARSVDEAESLEPPLPLISKVNWGQCTRPRHPTPGHGPVQDIGLRQCPCCPPAPRQFNNYCHHGPAGAQREPRPYQQLNPQLIRPQHTAAAHVPHGPTQESGPFRGDAIHEVSMGRTGPGAVMGEVRRTISLPEESRNVFITYSVDTAEEIIPFIRFLVNQGFNPAIDMFDNPIRRMGINRWMDRYLNDKSVLIIVVISPKYKKDVEGPGDDEHGLHTKYIHNQIQNEFIQQGCLNFRLVPVLFPTATKRHVPSWLQSTRIYRWPTDTQDLLLRLFREERYIIPPRGADLTITVRPV